uniref:Uncharacterized protein n=1 Tax=Romanomermis culicivorax TaxID=13658 RepID=A0A915HYE8_ROMCU
MVVEQGVSEEMQQKFLSSNLTEKIEAAASLRILDFNRSGSLKSESKSNLLSRLKSTKCGSSPFLSKILSNFLSANKMAICLDIGIGLSVGFSSYSTPGRFWIISLTFGCDGGIKRIDGFSIGWTAPWSVLTGVL